jgi:hypothetical protein
LGNPFKPIPKVKNASADRVLARRNGAFHIVGEGETLKHICHVYGLDLKKVAAIFSNMNEKCIIRLDASLSKERLTDMALGIILERLQDKS